MRLGLSEFKMFCKDFPTQGGQVAVALALIMLTGVIIAIRLALGEPFPDGYSEWFVFLGCLAGLANFGMIGKRATDRELWGKGNGNGAKPNGDPESPRPTTSTSTIEG